MHSYAAMVTQPPLDQVFILSIWLEVRVSCILEVAKR